jgi:hypothetical protein
MNHEPEPAGSSELELGEVESKATGERMRDTSTFELVFGERAAVPGNRGLVREDWAWLETQ